MHRKPPMLESTRPHAPLIPTYMIPCNFQQPIQYLARLSSRVAQAGPLAAEFSQLKEELICTLIGQLWYVRDRLNHIMLSPCAELSHTNLSLSPPQPIG